MKKITLAVAIIAVNIMACFASNPKIISCQVRKSDPTILDVKYIVYSQNPTVNVRALAFQDGERSFFKVVRPRTAVFPVMMPFSFIISQISTLIYLLIAISPCFL